MYVNAVLKTVFLTILALVLTAGDSHAFRNIKEGDAVPGFTLKDQAGAEVSLAAYAGKVVVVVVVFFKGDQDNSVKALADLQKVQEKYGKKGVQVIALSPDRIPGEMLASFKEKDRPTYPLLFDESKAAYGAWGVFLFPTTGVLDKEGKLLKHIPSYNREYGNTVEAYVRLALGEITAEELDKTLNPTDKAKLTPEQKKAERHMMLGERMVDRQLLDKATEEYGQAVESDPELAEARVKYGFVLLKLEKAEESRANFEKAMELNPKAEDAGAGLGAAHVQLGDLDKGIEVLEGALKMNPKPARVHFELGKAYEKKGMADKAAGHYRKAAEMLGGALW